LSKKKFFHEESPWDVEMMHFLLFSPVLLVPTLRFMTAYVALGQHGSSATAALWMTIDFPKRRPSDWHWRNKLARMGIISS
jgi:hypothetical protein